MKTPKAYYKAIATLTGCVIGAGIFGIPYVVVRSGFWTGMLVLVVLGLATLLVNLLTGEVSLRSNKCMQLPGYAEKYLGKKGKYLMAASMVIGVYGAMIAYTIGVSQSLMVIFGGSQWFWALIFYVIMSILLYGSLRTLETSEIWFESIMLVAFVIILTLLFSSKLFSPNQFIGFTWDKILFPYGVILFAFVGTMAIPEIREETKKCKKLTKRVIIIGSLIPLIVYVLFTTAVIGVTGGNTTEIASIGLATVFGGFGYIVLHLFAILAMASSFIALGYALKESYRIDFKLPHSEAWMLTVAFPVVLIMIGARSFVGTLEIAGAFAGGIAGITVVMMHAKAKNKSERKPEYTIKINWFIYGALILLFLIGIVYQLSLLL